MFTGFFVCSVLGIGPQEWPSDSEGIARQLLRVADNCVGLLQFIGMQEMTEMKNACAIRSMAVKRVAQQASESRLLLRSQ